MEEKILNFEKSHLYDEKQLKNNLNRKLDLPLHREVRKKWKKFSWEIFVTNVM